MPTWEDYDYRLRLAYAGYCFKRLPEKLLIYNESTGSRRLPINSDDRQMIQSMLEYIARKYEGIEKMGCNCKDDPIIEVAQLNDSDFIQAEYLGAKGNHIVVGVTTFDSKIDGLSMKRYAGKWRIFYGHISGGKKLPVHKLDIQNMPGKWRVLNADPVVSKPVQKSQLQIHHYK